LREEETSSYLTQRVAFRNLAKFPHKQLTVNVREYYWGECFHIHVKKRTPDTLVMPIVSTRKDFEEILT